MTFLRTMALASTLGLLTACSDDGVTPGSQDSSTDGSNTSGDVTAGAPSGTSAAVTTASEGTTQGSASASESGPASGTTGSGGSTGQAEETGGLDSTGQPEGTDTGTGTGTDTGTGTGTGTGTDTDTGTGTGTTTGGDGLADGESCAADDECQSGHCFVAGILGGICGECTSDTDCTEGGCTVPDVLGDPPQGSVCNMGELGGGCESEAVCDADLQCALIVDVPGVITVQSCSECETDLDCGGDLLCSTIADALEPDAYKACIAAGSIPNDQACDFQGSGDEACTSGYCAAASLQGLAEVGVCGACEVDADCPVGQTCSGPEVDLSGALTGATCI